MNIDQRITNMIFGHKHHFLTVLIIALFANYPFAQSPIYLSAGEANLIDQTPSLAGSSKCGRLGVNYLNRFINDGFYNSVSVSFDKHVDFLQGGIGIYASDDRFIRNDHRTTSFSAMYSYTVSISTTLSVKTGLKASLIHSSMKESFGFNELNSMSYKTIDGGLPGMDKTCFSIGAGILFFSKKFVISASLDHLNKPIENEYSTYKFKLPVRYYSFFLYKISSAGFLVIPNISYQYQDKRFQLYNQSTSLIDRSQYLAIGIDIRKEQFIIGIQYRYMFNSSQISLIKLGLKKQGFRIYLNSGIQMLNKKKGYINQISLEYIFIK